MNYAWLLFILIGNLLVSCGKGFSSIISSAIAARKLNDCITEKCLLSDIVTKYQPVHCSSGLLKIVCPFHDDHNPSMVINNAPRDGRTPYMHCFSCGKTTDAIGYIAKMSGISIKQTIRSIALHLSKGGDPIR